MRNQILTAALLTGALGLWAAPATAQETFTDTGDAAGAVAPGDPSVQGIALAGRVDFYGVYRDDFFDTIFNRGSASNTGEGYINARMSLAAEVTVMPGLWGVLEIETQADSYAGESHRAGDDNQIARFRQGFLVLDSRAAELSRWVGDMELKVGLQHVRYDVRGRGAEGHPFLIDIQRSENPFTGTPNLPTAANGTGGSTSTNDYWGGNAWVYNRTGQPKTQEAGGAMLAWHSMNDDAPVHTAFELGYYQIFESGLTQSDTSVAVANWDFRFGARDDDLRLPGHHHLFNILLAAFTHEDATVFNYGGGLDLLLGSWGEFYVESHGQTGEITSFRNAGGQQVQNQHRAWANYAGFRIQSRKYLQEGFFSKPYLDVSAWAISGDDGIGQETNKDFVSLENVHHALILEGADVGLDIDSNYEAIKGHLGLTVWQMFEVDLFVGGFWVMERPSTAPSGASRFLGLETDLRITFRPSDTFRLNLTIANLSYGRFWHDHGLAGNSAYAVAFGATASF